MAIPKRKRPWETSFDFWMMSDRVEHYFKLKTISLDRAVFIAIGMLPERYEPPFPVFFLDGIPFLQSDSHGWEGDDPDVFWSWMDDCKERWISDGGTADGLNLRQFIEWVTREYGEPHWLPELRNSGVWDEWTGRDALQLQNPLTRTPEQWRAHVKKVLQEHDGNQTQAAKALGISRARVGQLVGPPPDRKGLAGNPQDPFGIAAAPRRKR